MLRRALCCLPLFALMGAAPPMREPMPPSLILGEAPLELPSAPKKEKRETFMVNHVFAAAQEPGRLLAGDDSFLVYPPDVCGQCEHLGDEMGTVVHPVGWTLESLKRVRPQRSHGFLCGPQPPHPAEIMSWFHPLLLGHRWDILCPANPLVPRSDPRRVCFLFSGEVPPGRQLLAPKMEVSPATAVEQDVSRFRLYSSLEDYQRHQEALWKKHTHWYGIRF